MDVRKKRSSLKDTNKSTTGKGSNTYKKYNDTRRAYTTMSNNTVSQVGNASNVVQPKAQTTHVVNPKVNNNTVTEGRAPYTPAQIRTAYGFGSNYNGEGQTIAIVDAYGSPTITQDLQVFSQRFGLPTANLQIVYPQGQPTTVNPDWVIETSLDVEWVHALAPAAKILLVIAQDDTPSNMFNAVSYAVQEGANIVSMSWGIPPESSFDLGQDAVFKVNGVVFVASTGDSGLVRFPSTSPNVLAVGGTTLDLAPNGMPLGPQTAWNLSSGGVSLYQPRPSWQTPGIDPPPTTNRTVPDVAFYANPDPGVYVYTSTEANGRVGWIGVGGTSFSAPAWAALIADALPSGQRANNIAPTLYQIAGGTSYTNPYGAFTDISQGSTSYHTSGVGYDYVTGLGAPRVQQMIEAIRTVLGL